MLINNVEMYFQRTGNINGETIVLSHSLSSTADMWLPQLATLESNYDVIRYDIRGHGASGVPGQSWSLKDMAQDLWGLYKFIDKPKIHIVGLSMGGMIAQMFTSLYPDAVQSLVLANTMCYYGPDKQAMWDERINLVKQGGIEAIVESTAKRWFTEKFYNEQPAEIENIKSLIRKTTPEGFIACCEALKQMDLRKEIEKFSVPTTIIVGKEDPTTPVQESEYLASHIKNSKLSILKDAAHISNIEQKSAFNKVLQTHFNC